MSNHKLSATKLHELTAQGFYVAPAPKGRECGWRPPVRLIKAIKDHYLKLLSPIKETVSPNSSFFGKATKFVFGRTSDYTIKHILLLLRL